MLHALARECGGLDNVTMYFQKENAPKASYNPSGVINIARVWHAACSSNSYCIRSYRRNRIIGASHAISRIHYSYPHISGNILKGVIFYLRARQ